MGNRALGDISNSNFTRLKKNSFRKISSKINTERIRTSLHLNATSVGHETRKKNKDEDILISSYIVISSA